MLTYILKAEAVLKNVSNVQPLDNLNYPFDYKFKIQCGCTKIHDKPIEINSEGRFQVTGFRREANFLFKCKECNRERYATIKRLPNKIDQDNQWTDILMINTFGIRLLDFIPDDQFECMSLLSNSIIQEIDLSDGEWYDYDQLGNGEISISEVKWKVELVR
ncbi:hypothetical protein DFJ63DRAFT_185108 [Scheffersomyces coipomensis]|uniref:uncharacterized protein n=1 Tax=Scheffersomyces coipomensis TaxID=1788519 RepID=UPI00315D47ED